MNLDHFLLLGEKSRGLEALGKATTAGVLSVGAELLLNTQQLIVFGEALRTGRSSGLNLSSAKSANVCGEKRELWKTSDGVEVRSVALVEVEVEVKWRWRRIRRRRNCFRETRDLPGAETNGKVGNESRLGLTRAVRGHDTPAVGLRELNGLDRLGDGADLVDLEEKGVASLLLDGGLDAEGVGDEEVVADNLDLGRLVVGGPGIEVILLEGVLDGADVILLAVRVVKVTKLLTSEVLGGVRVGVLEVKVVLAVLVELGRRNIETNLDLASVAGSLDGLGEELKGLLGTGNVGGEATLVSDVDSVNAVLLDDDLLEDVVGLGADLHGLSEAGSAGGEEHELLEGKGVTSVRAAVDDVEGGAGEDVRLLDAGKRGNVSVQGKALVGGTGLGNSHGDTQDSVSTKLALVGSAVKLDHEVVDLLLRGDRDLGLDKGGADDVVDVLNGLGDTLADVSVTTVTELNGLVGASRSTGGDLGAEAACMLVRTAATLIALDQ